MRQGVPVELTFDRQESGDCTSRVVFPDFRASATLPAHQRTTVRLDPGETGEFGFACGMNMIRGTLIVEPGLADKTEDHPASVPSSPAEPAGDAEEAERARELADLARRVLAGVALTLPVLYAAAAMALSSLSVVGNASRLRRYRPPPLPPAGQIDAEPQVETPASAEPAYAASVS